MGILKLTGKCEHYRTRIESFLRHFDIISEGEVSILAIAIFYESCIIRMKKKHCFPFDYSLR